MSMDTGYRLADNSRQLRRLFDERVRGLAITGPQARLLLSLERNPGENQAFYAERLEIEPITLTRIVDRLEEAGWVERRRDPGDRRVWRIHLTDAAQPILLQLKTIADALFVDAAEGISPRVIEQTLAGMTPDTHLHVSFDVDFLDPDIAPGVGTTVPGGPTYREAQLCMEMIADSGRLASLDIVELNPALDVRNRTAVLAVDLVESLFGNSTLILTYP